MTGIRDGKVPTATSGGISSSALLPAAPITTSETRPSTTATRQQERAQGSPASPDRSEPGGPMRAPQVVPDQTRAACIGKLNRGGVSGSSIGTATRWSAACPQ
jgi:hypothetical protein